MSSDYSRPPLDFSGVSTYPIRDRNSKVHADMFAQPSRGYDSVRDFLERLPRILAGNGLRALAAAVFQARRSGKPVLWGIGGHIVKCGLGPVVVDLIKAGTIQGVAMNGSAAIHDFEVALIGSTSEEVDAELTRGRFGMAQETGELVNQAISDAARTGIGMGEGLCRFVSSRRNQFPFAHASILAGAHELGIPVTIHVAVGTDITHIHPAANGGDIGQTTFQDFRLFCSLVRDLHAGGVFINAGSAVVLPEVFLKAVSVVRNLGHPLENLTTANLDFIQHYRPTQNVLKRPTGESGNAIALTGHHELMIPLLAAAIHNEMEGRS